jgi:hypothetical protein
MDVIGYLCVSLGSSKVQVFDSLDSRHACGYPEAGFSSENGDRAWVVYYGRAVFCYAILWAKRPNAKDIKRIFLFAVGNVCWVKRFTAGSRNSLTDVLIVADDARPGRPVEIATEATVQRGKSWSWQVDNDRQCSKCTRLFPWFSIQHNAWSFEVSESVCMVGSQRTEGSRKTWKECVCPCNISYGT